MRILFLVVMASLSIQAQVAEILTVRPDGSLYPTGVVATITTLADMSASAQANMAQAQAVEQVATIITNGLNELRALENARNATGYIRLGVESFSPGIEADTNLTASIVKFAHASNTVDFAFYDIWTYFTSDPGVWPYVRTADSAGRTNAWDMLDSVSVSIGTVVVGSTEYEAYRNQVKMPIASTSSFFRVHADIQGYGTNQMYFPVNNGIAVNGEIPFTGTITDGTNTMAWVGGVRIAQP